MTTMDKYERILQLIGGRYFLIAGAAFLLFYVLRLRSLQHRKIQAKFPRLNDYLREIGYSILTIAIFALVPLVFIGDPDISKHTLRYERIEDRGWVYFFLMFPVMLFVHDTYFYWMHRMMHHPRLFRIFHLVHHQSTNPSPWAAYAFHPLEGLLEAGILVLFLFLFPLHKLHFFLFFFFMIVYNVYGHLGWELYPPGFHRTAVGRWINTSVAHNQHHRYFKGNYGLYFLFWDRWMGTLRTDYEGHYETARPSVKP